MKTWFSRPGKKAPADSDIARSDFVEMNIRYKIQIELHKSIAMDLDIHVIYGLDNYMDMDMQMERDNMIGMHTPNLCLSHLGMPLGL